MPQSPQPTDVVVNSEPWRLSPANYEPSPSPPQPPAGVPAADDVQAPVAADAPTQAAAAPISPSPALDAWALATAQAAAIDLYMSIFANRQKLLAPEAYPQGGSSAATPNPVSPGNPSSAWWPVRPVDTMSNLGAEFPFVAQNFYPTNVTPGAWGVSVVNSSNPPIAPYPRTLAAQKS